MLVLSIAWLGLLWFSFGIGNAILHRLQGNSFERIGDRFIISIWLGIIIISIALLTISLFLPLSSIFSLLTILFISLVAVFYKKSTILNELKNIRSSFSLFSILIVSGIILSIAAIRKLSPEFRSVAFSIVVICMASSNHCKYLNRIVISFL